jgi:hypothetical protein
MRKNWFIPAMFATLVLLLALAAGGAWTAQPRAALLADEPGANVHLPLVARAPNTPTPTATSTPTPTNTPTPSPTPTESPSGPLVNGSFENGWATIDFGNQRPDGWNLFWVQPGDPLFDSGDLASGICECVHKLAIQLPEHERPGGSDPLILEGETVYKAFSESQSFGLELSQTITGLQPGSVWRLTTPIRVHLYGETDPYAAESSVWINGLGAWANGAEMGDRQWCKHERTFTVPENGVVEVAIRMKSKWPRTKDFFIDDIRLRPASEASPYPNMAACLSNPLLIQYEPALPRE